MVEADIVIKRIRKVFADLHFFSEFRFVRYSSSEVGFERISDAVKLIVGMRLLNVSGGIQIDQFYSHIHLRKLERFLLETLDKNNVSNYGDREITVRDSVISTGNIFTRFPEIKDDSSFETVIVNLKHYLTEEVEPFFNKYTNLHEVNELIRSVPQNELSRYMDGYHFLKKLIVLKWCADSEYEKYKHFLSSELIKLSEADSDQYLPLLKSFLDLIARLESEKL